MCGDRLAVGYELLAELKSDIEDIKMLHQAVIDGAKAAGLEVKDSTAFQFQPHGVTVTAILAESHIALSTWAEKEYIAVDIFSCTTALSCVKALKSICESLKVQPRDVKGLIIPRPMDYYLDDGMMDLDGLVRNYED
jgi:S-adenosylmethionine decarboxylase